MNMSTIRNIAATALVAVAVFFVFRFFNPSHEQIELTGPAKNTDKVATTSVNEVEVETSAPDTKVTDDASPVVVEDSTIESDPVLNTTDEIVAEVATGTWNDEEIERLTELLNSDPAFMQSLKDDFRSETDPTRLKRLALLLGESDSTDLVPLAEEMLYSGNPESQAAAFLLLNRVQDRDPAAREVAMRVLGGESNPKVLVSAIDILARPAQIDEQQRGDIINHITPLISHDDASVRRRSYSTLARMSNDNSATDTLLSGLDDPDPKVRQSIAYSFITNVVDTDAVRYRLLSVAENSEETPITRRGAVQALLQMDLTVDEKERVDNASRDLNQ